MQDFKSEWFNPNQLQEQLDLIKKNNQKMPNSTLFGKLNFLVPKPQNKHFDGMNNFPVRAPRDGQ